MVEKQNKIDQEFTAIVPDGVHSLDKLVPFEIFSQKCEEHNEKLAYLLKESFTPIC